MAPVTLHLDVVLHPYFIYFVENNNYQYGNMELEKDSFNIIIEDKCLLLLCVLSLHALRHNIVMAITFFNLENYQHFKVLIQGEGLRISTDVDNCEQARSATVLQNCCPCISLSWTLVLLQEADKAQTIWLQDE